MFFLNFFSRNFLILQIIFSFFCGEILAKKSPSPEILKNNSENNILPKITITATNENQDGYKAESQASSTRTNKILRDIPQTINVVSQQQIGDQNIVNMEQATLYIPSVNIQQGEGNRDQISIRGNSSTADFFIDGARDDMQYFRDFYNIEKVEFLNGPNALAFGRGGAGGLVNRVSKFADGIKKRQIILSGGSFENRRLQTDLSEKINDKLSLRFNGFYEKSRTFRDYGNLERFGFNPTGTIVLGKNTDIKFGYEHFYDNRFNDRGVPSKNGEPLKTSTSKFFGNPNENDSENKLDSVFATINHEFQNQLQLKNYTRFTQYSKFYKNVFASGEVGASNKFNLSAYNNSQERKNFTNQTDLTKKFEAFSLKHLALFGTEITHQDSSASRLSGYFNNKNTSLAISIFDDINLTPITYRRASSDANNNSNVTVLGSYLQDQITFNEHFELTAGLRLDSFDIKLENKNTGQNFKRRDNFISPKVGLVFKPQKNLSIYSSYSTSYLPSAGDQFSSLDAKSKSLKPEKLQNYEIGTKWDITEKFNFNTAIFQLDRTNSRANDPSGSGYYVLTGSSKIRGFETSATGEISKKFEVVASYSHLDARISSDTADAKKGNKLALTPSNKIALWNKYKFSPELSFGLGFIKQSSQYSAVDNKVKLKGFNRFDSAIFYKIDEKIRAQINVENIFNKKYFLTAHNNNNLQFGSTRAFKASLNMEF